MNEEEGMQVLIPLPLPLSRPPPGGASRPHSWILRAGKSRLCAEYMMRDWVEFGDGCAREKGVCGSGREDMEVGMEVELQG
jgi:hypothetical protein